MLTRAEKKKIEEGKEEEREEQPRTPSGTGITRDRETKNHPSHLRQESYPDGEEKMKAQLHAWQSITKKRHETVLRIYKRANDNRVSWISISKERGQGRRARRAHRPHG